MKEWGNRDQMEAREKGSQEPKESFQHDAGFHCLDCDGFINKSITDFWSF